MSRHRGSVASAEPDPGREVWVWAGAKRLHAWLLEPPESVATIFLVDTHGSLRTDPRLHQLASRLYSCGWTACCTDLVLERERNDQLVCFDIPVLAERLSAVLEHRRRQLSEGAPLVLAGRGNAAAVCLWLAAQHAGVSGVVSLSGRPHLAEPRLGLVRCPTLLLGVEGEERLLHVNRMAEKRLAGRSQLIVIPKAPGGRAVSVGFTEAACRWLNRIVADCPRTAPPTRHLFDWTHSLLSSRLFKSLLGPVFTLLSNHWK